MLGVVRVRPMWRERLVATAGMAVVLLVGVEALLWLASSR